MTPEELIAEGRKIERQTILLTPNGAGEEAAIWYGNDHQWITDDLFRCWLAVDTKYIPNFDNRGWMLILTDDDFTSRELRVEFIPQKPSKNGTRLYPKEIRLIPPIDAVIARGSPSVDLWLKKNKWDRQTRYNSNFPDQEAIKPYETLERQENPLYWEEAYATLGGWHIGWADDGWHDLIDETLLVHTYRDSEPWLEVWKMRNGQLKVIERIT